MYEDLNSENKAYDSIPAASCNICQFTYQDDYKGLDNHMFDMHQIDIRAPTSLATKSYKNWMEHAALNVYRIKVCRA